MLSSALQFHVKVARPGLWLTAMWFYMLPLGGRDVFHSPTFWLGLFFVSFPLGHFIYGWNDIVDGDTDQLNPRKGNYLFGASGSHEELAKLPRAIVLVQLPFAIAFTVLLRFKALLWYAGLVLVTALYNWPRYGLKSRPPFEVLNQAGYLLVFVISSFLNHAPQLSWQAMLFGAMFAMHSHVFGEIMDIVPDRQTGRRTTATVIGLIPSKFVISSFLIAEGALVFYYFHDFIISGFLFLSGIWFSLDALFVWKDRIYSPGEMRFAMIAWNLLALGSMPFVWHSASLAAK